MARFVYSILLVLAAPIIWSWMWLRTRKTGDDWEILAAPRFGHYPQPWDGGSPIWIHAVSVGEVRAAVPLVQSLLLAGEQVLLTHMTPTGRDEARRLLTQEISEGLVRQQWVPYDFAGAVRRFLKHYRPHTAVLIEREVWPNLVDETNRAQIPVVLVSARFSEKTAIQTHRIDQLTGGLLRQAYASLHLVLAQTNEDAQRLFDEGAPRVLVCGNLKFDVKLPHVAIEAGQAWRETLARPVVVIASTRDGEEAQLIPLLSDPALDLQPAEDADPSQNAPMALMAPVMETLGRPLFVIVPRHPQRFDEVANLLDEAGVRYARWSMLRDAPEQSAMARTLDVVLGDTMGELPFFYGGSDVAIVGGSFEPFGGQNFIEASAIGAPVIVGPHTRNFKDAVQSAAEAGALQQVPDLQSALTLAASWLRQPAHAAGIGQTGREWVAAHVGATACVVENLAKMRTPAGVAGEVSAPVGDAEEVQS